MHNVGYPSIVTEGFFYGGFMTKDDLFRIAQDRGCRRCICCDQEKLGNLEPCCNPHEDIRIFDMCIERQKGKEK